MPYHRRPYHVTHFAVLLLGLFFFFSLILVFRSSRLLQFMLVCLMSTYYFLWGLIHHHREGTLHPQVTLEYLLIALLGVSLLGFIIYTI